MSAGHVSRDLEQRPHVLVQRGLATIVALCVLVAGFIGVQNGVFSSNVQVRAQVDDIGGALVAGNDVKIRGVIIGRVTDIGRTGDGVALTLSLDQDEAGRLPEGVRARILPATVFGTAFVDLVPPERPTGRSLDTATLITQDPTTETRELQDALDASFEILTAVGHAGSLR